MHVYPAPMGGRARRVGLVCALVLAVFSAASRADTLASENWSGYVAHGGEVAFRSVTGVWRQPAAVCPGVYPTWAATWVGLGGYSIGATELEQIGTELDCNVWGQTLVSAWYELLPGLPHRIAMTVRPGDQISAEVIASAGSVTVRLADRTVGQTFSKTIRTGSIDASSADWILEAPTLCDPYGNCVTTALTDFGSVRLSGARAETTAGAWGPITSPLWQRTKLTLLPDPYYYALNDTAALSTPTRLRRGGTAFAVDYSRTAASASRRTTTRDALRTRGRRANRTRQPRD